MDTNDGNPFEPPAQQLASGAIPFDGPAEEAAAIRQQGLNRETTLRALGAVKLATVASLLFGGASVVFARLGSLGDWIAQPSFPLPEALTVGGAALLAAVYSLVTAAGLWWLQPWGRWLQSVSSGAVLLLILLSMGRLSDLAEPMIAIFGGMLLAAVHTVLLMIVLSHPSGQVCGEEYAVVRQASGPLDRKHLWPKVALLSVLWLAGAGGYALLAVA